MSSERINHQEITYPFTELTVRGSVVARRLEEGDASAMLCIFNKDPAIQEHVTWTHNIHTVDEIKQEIRNMRENSYRFAIEFGGVIVGYIGYWEDTDGYMDGQPKQGVYGLGYFLDPEYRGQAIITDTVKALVDAILKSHETNRIEAWAEDRNIASTYILQKTGFKPTNVVLEEPVLHCMERRWSLLKDFE